MTASLQFSPLTRLTPGDSVGIISPSATLPAIFPREHALGLSRIREEFHLIPVELPHVADASPCNENRSKDLIEAFSRPELKAVITTVGGDVQVEYVKNLPAEPFQATPKPFFGYSDNTHIANHLFQLGIPSFYGGCVFTEFGMQGSMDEFTVKYLKHALFIGGPIDLEPANEFNDTALPWGDEDNLMRRRRYEKNEGWYWAASSSGAGYSWGGCVESIDELLRHNVKLPALEHFREIVLFLETCEEAPIATYVTRVVRALGERGILARVKGLLVGRPNARPFPPIHPLTDEQTAAYRSEQRQVILEGFRRYNSTAPVVQNLDFGHTAPTVSLPYGGWIEIMAAQKRIIAHY